MRLLFTGPLLDFSGFAHASRNLLRGLEHSGEFDIVARALKYDEADDGTEYLAEDWLQPLLEDSLTDIEILIQCTTANVEAVPKQGVLNGLYTFLELDRIPPVWAAKVNEFDFVIVPCPHNAQTLGRSGVTIPILVCPPPCDPADYEDVQPFEIPTPEGFSLEGRTVFYNVCQLSNKKGIDALLRSYYAAFADMPDDVLLVLKCYIQMSGRGDEMATVQQFIQRVRQACNLPINKWPPVYPIVGTLNDAEIQGLHAAGDCYVNASRGEGFGIPPFDALAHGNLLITHTNGGMEVYANQGNCLIYNAQMSLVNEMAGQDPLLYNGVSRWFEPNTAEMADLMRLYHLLKKGAAAGELDEHNTQQWMALEGFRQNAPAVVNRFDYRKAGKQFAHQIVAAFNNWQKDGVVRFDESAPDTKMQALTQSQVGVG